MGCFDKLIGREPPVPPTRPFDPKTGWASESRKTRRATTEAVCELSDFDDLAKGDTCARLRARLGAALR